MFKSRVKVTSDQMGNVIGRSSNNPEYGYIRITQKVSYFNAQGFLVSKSYSTLLKGRVEELQELNLKTGDELQGQIVIKEQLFPFYEGVGGNTKDLKYAGNAGIVCTVDDQPIYRQCFYTEDLNDTDVLITHTNSEDIKEAIKNNSSFSIEDDIEEMMSGKHPLS